MTRRDTTARRTTTTGIVTTGIVEPTTVHGSSRARRLKRLLPNPIPGFERNVLWFRNQALILATGVLEPVFYLLGMGLGLGNLVGDVEHAGLPVSFATFVAAGLMASTAMNGAIFDSTYNFYFKLKEERTFDAMLNAPLRMVDVLAGELSWAIARGSLYSLVFLAVAMMFGAVESWWAVLSLPSATLIATAFAAMGTFGTTFVRSWTDFDMLNLTILPMMMGSTTFFPLSVYPGWAQPFVQATPLYHGVTLIRDLNTGLVGWHDLGHVAYLVVMAAVFGWAASRRLDRLLAT